MLCKYYGKCGNASAMSIGFWVAIFLLATWQVYESVKKYEADPMTIEAVAGDPIVVPVGGSFEFERYICQTKDLDVIVHREYVRLSDGERFMIPSVNYGAKRAGCFTARFSSVLPSYMPPGEYEYRPILNYKVNDSLIIRKASPSVKIEVTND